METISVYVVAHLNMHEHQVGKSLCFVTVVMRMSQETGKKTNAETYAAGHMSRLETPMKLT